jgi:hypothetical protein
VEVPFEEGEAEVVAEGLPLAVWGGDAVAVPPVGDPEGEGEAHAEAVAPPPRAPASEGVAELLCEPLGVGLPEPQALAVGDGAPLGEPAPPEGERGGEALPQGEADGEMEAVAVGGPSEGDGVPEQFPLAVGLPAREGEGEGERVGSARVGLAVGQGEGGALLVGALVPLARLAEPQGEADAVREAAAVADALPDSWGEAEAEAEAEGVGDAGGDSEARGVPVAQREPVADALGVPEGAALPLPLRVAPEAEAERVPSAAPTDARPFALRLPAAVAH